MEFVNTEGLRLDGRRPPEMRQLRAELGVVLKADGSASFEMGNTKVIAAVYGPREWVVQGAVDVDTVLTHLQKVVVRMRVLMTKSPNVLILLSLSDSRSNLPLTRSSFYMRRYVLLLSAKLEGEAAECFKANVQSATKYILSKIKDCQFFVGESMADDGVVVLAYYKEGAIDPTFLYFAHGLEEVKC